MDELQKLKLQEATMIIELKVLQFRISLLEQASNKPQKDIDIPCASNSYKISAIPEQTASGKESSNPLIPSILEKDVKDVSSSKLVKPTDFISGLRPNTKDIQSLNKSEGQTSVSANTDMAIQKPKDYYVVFNGPFAGIYTTWEIAKNATEGISGIRHRKYKTLIEAKVAGDQYAKEHLTTPPKLVSSADCLKATFKEVLKKEKKPQNMVSIGRISTITPVEKKTKFVYSEEGLSYLYKYARLATEGHLIEDKFYTTDRQNISLFNFIEGADPELVNEAYRYGMVKMIYPSKNLLEISLLPEEIKKAIKVFRTKVVKEADRAIYLKISSTLPIWKDGMFSLPFSYIEIGISKTEKDYSPSKYMEVESSPDLFEKINVLRMGVLIDQVLKITDNSCIKINYQDFHTLVVSKSFKTISEEDIKSFLRFEKTFRNGQVMSPHNEEICSLLKKAFDKAKTQYQCVYCEKEKSKSLEGLKIIEEMQSEEASSAYDDNTTSSTEDVSNDVLKQ